LRNTTTTAANRRMLTAMLTAGRTTDSTVMTSYTSGRRNVKEIALRQADTPH
jgi:hypothetical protein